MELKFWYGIWKMPEWNGMEWKISRIEWKTIFHISIPIPYYISCIAFTEKHILYECRGVINNIVALVFHFNIYVHYLWKIAVLWLYVLRGQCMHCIIVSTLQFAALML